MGWRGLFEGWHLVVLIIVIVLVFGWKRLPDAARSLGRSMRIFKAEVEEMKGDPRPSAASQDTVRGQASYREANERGTGTAGTQGAPGGTPPSPTPPAASQDPTAPVQAHPDPTATYDATSPAADPSRHRA